MSTHLQMTLEDVLRTDITSNRHRNNPQSEAAYKKVASTKQDTYKRIMTLLTARGEYGATSKEIAAAFGVELNTISGRFSEMKSLGWIRENGARRNGAAVLVVKG